MKIGHLKEVILYVENMNSQVLFYKDKMGLEVDYPKDTDNLENEKWVVFQTGPCRLALRSGGRCRLGEDAPKMVFEVEDLPKIREELIRRGVPLNEIWSPAAGIFVSDGVDPEGNSFSIESAEPCSE
jgi:predicted enzyme related to lactoylglutathione lyase